MSSLEEQFGQLQARVSELEARLLELRTSRDRLSGTIGALLNLEGLNEMVRRSSDPRTVLRSLHEVLAKFLPFEDLAIFLFAEGGKGLEPLGHAPPELVRAAQSQLEEGVLHWVVSERRPVVVPWLEGLASESKGPEVHLIIIPMVVSDQAIGVGLLSLLRPMGELTPIQTRLLYFIFSHAAVAIQNASHARGIADLKDFFSDLLENAGDIIFALDRRGRFTYSNASVEELGMRKEELVGHSFQTLFKRAEVAKRINSTLAQGTRQIFDLELRTRMSRPQQFTVHLAPLRNAAGERTGALGIMRNVTDLSRLQKKLLESERLAAYTQTVITLNHEINNPLTTVMGNLFLLEKEAQKYNDEKISSRLSVIQANCQRIQNVIKKLERIEELKTIPYLGGTKMVDIRGSSEDAND